MSRGPFATPDRTRGGLLAPFLVALLALGACALIGFEHVRPALDEGPDTARDAGLLGAMAVGALATLVLVVRLARPRGPNPQDISAPPPPATAPTAPTPSTVSPAQPEPLADVMVRRARTIRRVFFVISAVMTLLVAATIALTAFRSREVFRSIDVPRIPAPEHSCPAPTAGADALDDRRTDCLPLDEEGTVFETGPATIQGVDYVGLDRRSTSCGQVSASLGASCEHVVRGLYERSDSSIVGAVTLVAMDTKADAERVASTLDPADVTLSPADADADATGWNGPRSTQTCFASIGRYVTCLRIAPRGSATDADVLETARHLNFLATDVVVARRFRLS